MLGQATISSEELARQGRSAIAHAAGQLRRTRTSWPPDRPAPVHTRGGRWYRPDNLWTDWTPGFYAGQMWILARLTGEGEWRAAAEAHTLPLKPRRFDRDVHDLGFIFLSTYRRWFDLLPPADPLREPIREVLVTAATVQSFRWRELPGGRDGFVYSFNGPQSLFIDTLMNVRLLFWAAQHDEKTTSEGEVGRRAREHAFTSLRYLVRQKGPALGDEDGRVAHEAIFNTEPGRGEFRCLSTQQGYSPFTAWSRGLAWALYGFADAHAWTSEPQFLEAAERCAGFFLSHTPADGVPYWDYGAPRIPEEPLDSSAAAIIACGLLLLARQARGPAADRYRQAAARILETLLSEKFLSQPDSAEEGILLHGTYHRPRNWGIDSSVMWGDYFFLEAIERLLLDPA